LANRYYQDMVGEYYGVRWIENYILSEQPLRSGGGAPFGLDGLFPESHALAKSEHPFPIPYVGRFTTMLIEPPVYLNAVMRDFLLAGGKIVVREFAALEAFLSLPEPVILSCTGLGAKALLNDEDLTPIKGSSPSCCRSLKWITSPSDQRASICFRAATASCWAVRTRKASGPSIPTVTRPSESCRAR
jgi:hypothetical protein